MTEALQKLKKLRLWIKFQVSCQQTGYKMCEKNVTFVKIHSSQNQTWKDTSQMYIKMKEILNVNCVTKTFTSKIT